MMRELAKSFLSFSGGMSLLGAMQALNLLAPKSLCDAGNPAATVFQRSADAAKEQLAGPFQEAFLAFDQMQRNAIDLAFRSLPAGADLCKWAGSLIPVAAASGGSGAARRNPGWGPVRPA